MYKRREVSINDNAAIVSFSFLMRRTNFAFFFCPRCEIMYIGKTATKQTSDRDLASSFFLLPKTGVRFRNESASNFNANSSSAGANWKVLFFSFVRSLAYLGWYFWAVLASFERNVHVFAYVKLSFYFNVYYMLPYILSRKDYTFKYNAVFRIFYTNSRKQNNFPGEQQMPNSTNFVSKWLNV